MLFFVIALSVWQIALACAFFILGSLWLWVLLRLRFTHWVVIGALASLLACLSALYHMPIALGMSDQAVRSPDWEGHFEYIRYMASHWSIPPLDGGWQFYQPPLYYLFTALLGRTGEFLHFDFLQTVRYFSVVSTLVFELYGLLIIRRAIRTPWIAILCSLTLLSWPLLLMLFGRISNEILLYPLWAVGYYYLLRWRQQRHSRDLGLAIGLCGVMMLVKTSALVLLGTVGAVILHDVITRRVSWHCCVHPVIGLAMILVLIAGMTNFGRTMYYNFNHQHGVSLIVGNLDMNPGLIAGGYALNTLRTFIAFDIGAMVRNPYLSFDPATGDKLFWNSYLKTALFGFFSWPNYALAAGLNVVLALLAAFTAIAAIVVGRANDESRFFIISIAVALGAQMFYRLITVNVLAHDARYTFPSVIAFVTLTGFLIERLRTLNQRVLAAAGCALLLAFCSIEFMFMVAHGN